MNNRTRSASEVAMGMSGEVWARHANPWSVWTRVPILAGLTLAIWSRVWLGWWCLVPVGLLAVWTWLNPRAFPPPRRVDSWASRAVLGEQLWLNRRAVPIPPAHERMARWLLGAATLGMLPWAWGLWTLAPWPTLLGLLLIYTGKMWFLDRMVWLYEDRRGGGVEGGV